MKAIIRSGVVLLSMLLLGVFSVMGQSVPELFQKAKEQFKAKSFKESLGTVEQLDAASRQPGMERDRVKLEPAISFYRAANLSMLGQRQLAVTEFEKYLILTPNTALDTSVFPKEIVDAFNTAKKNVAKREKDSPVATAYARFRPEPGKDRLTVDERWNETAVRVLLTDEEKAQWSKLMSQSDREAFVEAFWKRHDPTPDTQANEFRAEFERRVLFADLAFASEKRPGRETDRGVVFAVFGPPTYIGVAQLSAENDPIETMRSQEPKRNLFGTTNPEAAPGRMPTPPAAQRTDTLQSQYHQGSQEAWYYRIGNIPPSVKLNELKFDFIGSDMQKDSRMLLALGQAAKDADKYIAAK